MWKTSILVFPPFWYISTISLDTLYFPQARGATRRRSLASMAPSLRCKVPGTGGGWELSPLRKRESTAGWDLHGVATGVLGVTGCSRPSWLSGHIICISNFGELTNWTDGALPQQTLPGLLAGSVGATWVCATSGTFGRGGCSTTSKAWGAQACQKDTSTANVS